MLETDKLFDLVEAAERADWSSVGAHYLVLARKAQGERETVFIESLLPLVGMRDAGRVRAAVEELMARSQLDR